jgi:hypothetical protein
MQLTWRQVTAWRTERHHFQRRAPAEEEADRVAKFLGETLKLSWRS